MLCKAVNLNRFLLFCLLIMSSLWFDIGKAFATSAFDVHRARSGHVLARGLILESDLPIWAQYDEYGKIVGGEFPYASFARSYAISADSVNRTHQALEQLKTEFGDRLVVMSREQYATAPLQTGLKQSINKIYLSESTKSVVFLETKSLVSPKQHSILLRARFDLNAITPTNGSTKSLLLDNEGRLIASSEYNFAFKSGFFEGDGGKPPILGNLSGTKPYAPFKDSFVEVLAPYGGMAVTEEDGKWVSLYSLIPCPMFFFEYNTPAHMLYYYANFNPKARSAGFDYQVLPGYDFCIGYDELPITDLTSAMVKVAIIGIQASIATPYLNYNFFVDTNILGGQAELYNPFQGKAVSIGSETKYIYRSPEIKANEKPTFYFDGDELAEYILYGEISSDGEFVCKENIDDSQYYGVYFSSNGVKPSADCTDEEPELQQPDLVRVVDIVTDNQPQGLLESLSKDHLRDTDIFVFRESTGMLLTQRKGKDMRDGMSFYDVINDKFSYQLHMRGPKTLSNHILRDYRGEEGLVNYQSKSHMNPELHRRKADHLKPNEMLRIILINRKTGYIGSKLRSFSDIANQNEFLQEIDDFYDITRMYPPNLKITAERIYQPNKNSIKTGQQKNLISYEGSALSTDSMLVITTEWFDHDGSPLPKGLTDYGYTGRLAKTAGENALVTVGGQLANFAIKPGRNIVQINLPGGAFANEHFYIHINGEPISESPSFAETGAGDGLLGHRPKYYVPFKVPVFDEELTTELTQKYKMAVNAGEVDGLKAPEPIYHYVYRPEYQFSTYELKINDILRKTADDNIISLYPKERPLIGSSDDMVTMMYDLLASNSDALEFLGEGQELVFSLGADEIKATIGESGQVRFERLDHIAALEVEDFVTLSLYNNTDPTNVLWDYAFEAVALDTRWAGYDNIGEDGTIYVSADEPVVPLQSLIVGYANRDKKVPVELKWDKKGSASFINIDKTNAQNGVFSADIELPPYTGTKATPFVYFAGDKDNYVIMDAIEVVPGKPANLSVTAEGDAYMEGVGQINVELEAKDKNGNIVADGTSFIFSLDGHGIVTEASDSFNNGKASLVVKGGYLPDDKLKLKVTTGDVSQEIDLVIQPLTVVIEDYPLNMEAGQVYEVRAKVTKPGGGSAPGVSVWFETNGGRLEQGTLTTNSDGLVTAKIHTGFHALEQMQISARVGLVKGDVVEGDITAKPKQSAALRMQTAKQFGQQSPFSTEVQLNAQLTSMASPVTQQNAANSIDVLVFGEADVDGEVGLTREDDSVIKLPYSVTGNLALNGQENTSQFVSLGTLAEPNLQPISAYFMNELVEELVTDANQLHNGKASFVKRVKDHPTQTGFSYQFQKQASQNPAGEWLPSQIVIPADERFKPVNSVGFRLDLKAEAYDSTVFDFEGGAQGLNLNQDGTMTYYLHNKSGKISITSTNAINLSEWVTVAAKYQGGELQLEVNGQLTTANVPDKPLVYSVTSRGLTIGKGLNGNLSSVKFYDYESQPLLSFADGTQFKQIDFGTGETQTLLPIKSTGNLNKNGESAGIYRIGINVDGQQYFASVIGEQSYLQMMRMMAVFNAPDGYPPVALKSVKYTPFPLIPVAHAWFDFSWDGAWEGLKAVAGAIIPYEAIGVVAEQVVFLAKDDSRFDPLELALNAIEVLTIVPVAKPLIPIIRPVKAVFKSAKSLNPKFLKSLGGVIGKTMDQILKRDFDKALTILPFLVIAGEMAADAEAREGLMVLIKSVSSSDDILAWMEYLSLPADGWDGDEVPEVDLTAYHSEQDAQPYFSPLNAVMGVAYASNKKKGDLVDVAKLVPLFKKISKGFPKNGAEVDGEKLVAAVKSTTKGMKNTDNQKLRKLSHNPLALFTSSALGAGLSRKFFETSRNLRMSPLSLMAIITYLEIHRQPSCSDIYAKCKPFPEQIKNELNNLYATTVASSLNDNVDWVGGREIGGAFHLAMLAKTQLSYEISGTESLKPIGAEVSKDISIVELDRRNRPIVTGESYKRRIDILLKGESGNDDILSKQNIWVEVKSIKYKANYLKTTWKPWNMKGNTYSYHRQFYLDRVGTNQEPLSSKVVPQGNNFEWWLQDFKKKTRRSYTSAERDKIATKLRLLPTRKSSAPYASVGYKSRDDHNEAYTAAKVIKNFEAHNVKNWVINDAKQYLFTQLDDKVIAELINE